jgi:alkanesulfonate monooxygenase SsuD/methylene tetrahydromethanopterin reductase-like flavin-dependent oxidoreductase (luciferase family)
VRFSVFSVTDHYPDGPASTGERYARLLDQIALADELGFDSFFVAEHHFDDYGIVPSPNTLLAAAAARTARIGLGVAVSVLPFRNPLLVAEEYAVLDQLSGGRLRLGVGSGYLRHEFDGFGLDPAEKRDRFDEALEVLLAAWRGEPFSYRGRYHQVNDTRIAVTPAQRPHPPLWVAILRAEAARHVGSSGRSVMLIPYATCSTVEDLGPIAAEHRAGFESAGAPGQAEVAAAFHGYVSTSPAAARAESEPWLDRYVGSRRYARKRSYDELLDAGLLLAGDPDTVAAQIAKIASFGVRHVLLLADFGAMPPEQVAASLTRFARDVIPRC